ncbi:hypothetical protein JXA02_03145 [candidate division KSB1 bacterium]|nr:hypothetical protein [candidate division KSB1 bacterium]RQW09778.1 MAG: hypothetical protein EH222_03490 [candidate division KSB1 bacterium]
MELVGLVSAILLALAMGIIVRRAFPYRHNIPLYRVIRGRFRRKKAAPEEPSQRMFVAIRRLPEGRKAMLNLEDEEYEARKRAVLGLLNDLVGEWSTAATFKWGFHGSEYGLPSSNEESWVLFATFVVADHEAYRQCLNIMQGDKYMPLRKQCDIRLLYGEKMAALPLHTIELFRQTFGK